MDFDFVFYGAGISAKIAAVSLLKEGFKVCIIQDKKKFTQNSRSRLVEAGNRDILVHPPMPATPPFPLGPRVFRLTPIYLRSWQDVALFSSLLPVPCRRCLSHRRALGALGEGRLPEGDGAGRVQPRPGRAPWFEGELPSPTTSSRPASRALWLQASRTFPCSRPAELPGPG